MTNQQNIDQAKSEAFAEHMLGVLNSAGLSLPRTERRPWQLKS